MALTPSRIIIAEDTTGTAFKSFTDTSANHAQAVALVDVNGNHAGIHGTPAYVVSTAYMSSGIMAGRVYSVQEAFLVPNNGVRNYRISLPSSTTRVFLKYAFELQNAFEVGFYEAPTFSSEGTLLNPVNHNRNVFTPSIVGMGAGAIVANDGTLLTYGIFDATGTTQAGDLPNGEWILRDATQYLLKFVNDANQGTIRVKFWWLEIPPTS